MAGVVLVVDSQTPHSLEQFVIEYYLHNLDIDYEVLYRRREEQSTTRNSECYPQLKLPKTTLFGYDAIRQVYNLPPRSDLLHYSQAIQQSQ